MTVTTKNFVTAKFMENALTAQYQPTGAKGKIMQVAVSNQDTATRSFSIHIVPSAGTAGNSNRFIKDKVLQPGETYGCPEIVGMIVDSGGSITTIASAANAINMQIAGAEIT